MKQLNGTLILKIYFCVVILFFVFPVIIVAKSYKAVTYELSAGRFGDNLLSYMHAKWISYIYNIPLLYKPFIYSKDLVLHEYETRYDDKIKQQVNKVIVLNSKTMVNLDDSASILYVVPYFPESTWELKNCTGYSGGKWDYAVSVDWKNKGFIQELRRFISPLQPIAPLILPSDRISVAVHVRRGGNYDTSNTFTGFSLKFLYDEFFIQQIRELYYFLNEKSLYVHIFTDDLNPAQIMNTFKNNLEGLDIQFNCREGDNSDTLHVIEDFFAMQQFDCLIHSESNFSFTMSKIGDYMISLFPDSFCKKRNKIMYDHINISINSASIKN